MRKTFFIFGVTTLLYAGSIAYGNPSAKSPVVPSGRPTAPIIARLNDQVGQARVRIVERGTTRTMQSPSSASSAKNVPPSTLLPVVDQPDIQEKDRVFLDRVLRALPSLCLENLEHIIVRYNPNAERGQATATTMLLRGPLWNLSAKKKMEMVGVITHECGHIISLGDPAFTGSKADGVSPFPDGHMPTYNGLAAKFYAISWKNPDTMKPEAKGSHFVSGYAKENPFEDFAEAFAYRLLHEGAFRERAETSSVLAEKLAFMDMYVLDPAFTTPPSGDWNGRIPWDVTKLSHQLAL